MTAVDLSERGESEIATTYLKVGDRVGAVALGGMLRWLGASGAAPQALPIAELALDPRRRQPHGVRPLVNCAHRPANGALVILFSPLLDERAVAALTDLRGQGYAVVVVDGAPSQAACPAEVPAVGARGPGVAS